MNTETAHASLLGALLFGLGIVVQAILMLRGRFQSGDGGRVALALLIPLAAMLPRGADHGRYNVPLHLFVTMTLAGLFFAYLFRERLIVRIGGRLLLAWNLVLLFVVARTENHAMVLLLLISIPTLLTLINAFSDLDRRFGWQVFFYAWFSSMLVIIAIAGLDFGALGMFFESRDVSTVGSRVEMLTAGAAYLYLVANAWFILALIPWPWHRGQSWKERMEEVRRHAALLAYGYVWEKDDPFRSLAVLVVLPLFLIAAARVAQASEGMVVSLAIALIPALATNSRETEEDGVGALPSSTRKVSHWVDLRKLRKLKRQAAAEARR